MEQAVEAKRRAYARGLRLRGYSKQGWVVEVRRLRGYRRSLWPAVGIARPPVQHGGSMKDLHVEGAN